MTPSVERIKEYFTVYDKVTGKILRSGSCPPGMAKAQINDPATEAMVKVKARVHEGSNRRKPQRINLTSKRPENQPSETVDNGP